MQPVDRIVSLGGMCEVAYQARRLMRSDRAYPFDWWCTPIQSVPGLLAGRCQDQFKPEHIVKVPDFEGKRILISTTPGSSHIHEFPHHENFLAYEVEDISRRLTEKYAFLWSRMLEDCGEGSTLFIRQRMADDRTEADELSALVAEIEAALARVSPRFHLLLLDYEPALAVSERVIQCRVPRYKGAKEFGSDRGWDEMLASLPVSLGRRNGKQGLDDLKPSYDDPRPLPERLAAMLGLKRLMPRRG